VSSTTDPLFRTALELAAQIRAGEFSARELTEAALQRAHALQGELNPFTHLADEAALAAADAIAPGDPRPFAGVPVAIKDNRPAAGMPITMGSDLWGDTVADHDAHCVRRLREAGCVLIGRTTMPEMGILPTTETRRYGPTRNPWDPERTPGGSSGGAAAAVAAGIVPFAHGNDGGGSIRIPAACCGLVGLKPARGRVSPGPDQGLSFLTVDGVLTRSVADTAAALDVLAGYEPGDAIWAPDPPAPFAELAAREPGRLRIALVLNPPLDGAEIDPVCERAARDAAQQLADLGHHIEEATAPWSGLNLLPDFTRAFGPQTAMGALAGAQASGREVTKDSVEPLTWRMWENARRQDTMSLLSAQARLESVARAVVAWSATYDLVLTPALARRPVAIGEINGLGADAWEHYRRSGAFTPYTAIVNVTGQPAVTLPLYQWDDGLPLAVQLIGRPAREDQLLAVARTLEQALPWADRRPPRYA
jgi:amidase